MKKKRFVNNKKTEKLTIFIRYTHVRLWTSLDKGDSINFASAQARTDICMML